MKNNNQIKIVYKHYIPNSWILEFEDKIKSEKLSVQSIKDNDEVDNFDGPELSDIIIYISTALVSPAIYDIIKYGVIKLYKNLMKLEAKNNTAEKKKISIRCKDEQKRKLNLNIEGDYSEDLIEEIVEKSFDFIKSDKKESLYAQEDFVSNADDNPIIELQYNQESKQWEAVNFGNIRRFWKKKEDELDNLY